ncbi:hypothetical protein JOB18_013864 [Solea senegalensis]|uniref:Uncharacterized protein n=1 Tax=Solea senegalensis TaxID=28829 RepID=A0AAV6QSX3_SOLSE|nr:uncharacterized protein LOC122766694 [Solea senegalensis]KAG7496191.1 hypothetical protein JOB18_013864 [Solea senegalensis]
MDYNEGDLTTRPRRPVVIPVSTRTLHHPSFQSLYMAAAFARHHRGCNDQTVAPISPAEFFYTDPTMSYRIPNFVTELRVTDSLQLNTPPPVMSACLAPPNRPDPFRSGSHPTRDLGGSEWVENPISTPVQPSCYVVQLTQEEDQVITNLLKLHHKELGQIDETQMEFDGAEESPVNITASFSHSHCQPVILTSLSDEEHRHKDLGLQSKLQQGRRWSDAELEAADTLLSCCCVEEEDQERGVMLPLPLPSQHNEDLVKSTEIQPGSETLTTFEASNFTQNDTCINENREPIWRNFRSVEDISVSKVKQMLSDSEGDALCVLLSLGDVATLNILQ